MPRKELQGIVVSSGKMNKTVKVVVSSIRKHPLYKKYLKKTKKYLVHDEKNECRVGDIVLIREARPISKLKRFYVKSIIKKGTGSETFEPGIESEPKLELGLPLTEIEPVNKQETKQES